MDYILLLLLSLFQESLKGQEDFETNLKNQWQNSYMKIFEIEIALKWHFTTIPVGAMFQGLEMEYNLFF